MEHTDRAGPEQDRPQPQEGPSRGGGKSMLEGSRATSKVNSLQDLANRLSQLLRSPITIEAPDFALIAHSPQTETVDEIRRLTVLHRRVPEPVVQALWDTGIINQLNTITKPIRTPRIEMVGLDERVVMPIRTGGVLRGHIWVHETGNLLSEEDLTVLEYAGILAEAEFVRLDQEHEIHQRLAADMFHDLVAGEEEAARVKAQRAKTELPKQYRIFLVQLDDEGPLIERLDRHLGNPAHATDQLRRLLNLIDDQALRLGLSALTLAQNGAVLAILGWLRRPAVPDVLTDGSCAHRIRKAARDRGYLVSVAMSDQYGALSKATAAYKQASRCMQVARLLGIKDFVVSPGTLGALQLVPLLADAYGEPHTQSALHEAIRQMLAEAQGGVPGISPLETLEAYLDSGGCTPRAAEQLHIHVNTLNYRLRRISERYNLDLNDGLARLALHLELKLRRVTQQQDR